MPGVATVSVTISNPLSAQQAAYIGLPAAALNPGDVIVCETEIAQRLVAAGYGVVGSWPPPEFPPLSLGLATAPAWQANTAYATGQLVFSGGGLYRAKTSFTSGSSFNPANWDLIGTVGGSVVASGVGFTPAGTLTSTNVQAALAEIGSRAAPGASSIPFTPAGGIAATNVQAALAEVGGRPTPNATNIAFAPTGTIAATTVQAAIAEVAAEAGTAPTAASVPFTPTGSIAATNVQAAIAEVAAEAGSGGAGVASAVTFTPTGSISATNVQAALAEVASEAAPASAATASGTSFTPTGTVAATTVQGAIAEVAAEAAPASAGTAAGTSFTPTGSIAATTVQAALAEVASEAAPAAAGTAVGTSFTPTGTIAATNVQTAIAEVAAEAAVAANIAFTPTGTISATTVQAAIVEVAAEAGSGGATTALNTTFTPVGTISSTNVQDALAEVASEVGTAGSIAFTPTGTVAATNVQAAIAEVASEAAPAAAATATGTSFTPAGTLSSTNVQAALAEVGGRVAAGVPFTPAGGIVATNVQAALAEVGGRTPAATTVAFTPTGSVAATNVQAAIAEVAGETEPLARGLRMVSTSYTLVLDDASLTVEMTAQAPNFLTIPLHSVVPYAVGTIVKARQYGPGLTTINGQNGVTVRSRVGASIDSAGQYSEFFLTYRGNDEWIVSGAIVAGTPPVGGGGGGGTPTTIYVATTGNDTTGDGSIGLPFATISKAASVAVAGSTITVADGTYGPVSMTTNAGSGTSAARTVIKATNKWGAIISSSTSTVPWTIGNKSTANPQYIDIQDFEITGPSAASGLVVDGSNIRAIGNHVHHINNGGVAAGAGIFLEGLLTAGFTGSGLQAIGNKVHDVGSVGNPNVGLIACFGPNAYVANNIIYNSSQYGVNCYRGASNAIVVNNLIWGCTAGTGTSNPNILSTEDATLEAGTTGTWVTYGASGTLSNSATFAAQGTKSLKFVSTASGDIGICLPYGPTVVQAVSASTTYSALASFRAAATARTCQVYITWYNSSKTAISDSAAGSVTSTTSGFSQANITATSPAGAAYATVRMLVVGSASGETVYFDKMGLFAGTVTTWSTGSATPSGVGAGVRLGYDPAQGDAAITSGFFANNQIIESDYAFVETGVGVTGTTYANNNFWNLITGTYNLRGTSSISGQVDGDPLFTSWNNNGAGTYTLQGTSNCIGTGTLTNMPATDYAGTARSGADIGPYEGVATTPPPPPPPSGGGGATGPGLYVATSGSDSNPGTSAAPFATIRRAAQAATPGTTIWVANGTYGPVDMVSGIPSGTAAARIVIRAANRWGAKIQSTSTTAAWWVGDQNASKATNPKYIDVVDFEITAPSSHYGLMFDGSFNRAIGNHIHHVNNNTSSAGGALCLEGFNGGDGGTQGQKYNGQGLQALGNYVHHAGTGGNTLTHLIYPAAPDAYVANNLCHSSGQHGIHCFHGNENNVVVNNTVFDCPNGAGILFGSGQDDGLTIMTAYAANNIVANCNRGISEAGGAFANRGTRTYRNNRFWNTGGDLDVYGGTTQSSNTNGDPGFVAWSLGGLAVAGGSGDYHLSTTSACRNAGTSTNAPSTDYDGNARPSGGVNPDIGAFETSSA